MTEPTLVKIGNRTYDVASFSQELQDMIGYYQRWTSEKIDAMSEVNKCDAALRALDAEIIKRLAELEAQEKAKAAVPPP